jgi:predicted O-methyltransferase YrrM
MLQRLLWALARRTFSFWERLGLHVTPVHFYQPVPDTRELGPSLWERRSNLVGVDMAEAEQLVLLSTMTGYRDEYAAFGARRAGDGQGFHFGNAFLEAVDAEVLYALVRHLRPRRLIEIGSGYSTLVAAEAARRNAAEGSPCRITAIEPFPSAMLRAGVPGVELRAVPLQSVALSEFEALCQDDILFIDSSHVLKIGGDVQYEFLEILPRLARGVTVHVHDIFLPAEYPKAWVLGEHRFWTEQYLLQAFLAFNAAFKVIWAGHFMHGRHPEKLAAAFPSYDPARAMPGSFWMRRVA